MKHGASAHFPRHPFVQQKTMSVRDTKELEKRLERLRAKNKMLREDLSAVKKEKQDLESPCGINVCCSMAYRLALS